MPTSPGLHKQTEARIVDLEINRPGRTADSIEKSLRRSRRFGSAFVDRGSWYGTAPEVLRYHGPWLSLYAAASRCEWRATSGKVTRVVSHDVQGRPRQGLVTGDVLVPPFFDPFDPSSYWKLLNGRGGKDVPGALLIGMCG